MIYFIIGLIIGMAIGFVLGLRLKDPDIAYYHGVEDGKYQAYEEMEIEAREGANEKDKRRDTEENE